MYQCTVVHQCIILLLLFTFLIGLRTTKFHFFSLLHLCMFTFQFESWTTYFNNFRLSFRTSMFFK
uniref:Uncharacterized protein n=1 Tax=Zea mays TaxID=4577 RepID=B4FYP7_MAIZE|nr:unknown [Zea mays]